MSIIALDGERLAADKRATLGTLIRTPYPVKYPPQQFAIGSGRDFALAAMHLGKTATEAVEVACVFDSGCGNGTDVLTHNA